MTPGDEPTTHVTRDMPVAEHKPQSAITLQELNKVDDDTIARLSELSLPEIAELKQHIASIFPAGNLPGLILAGLTTLKSRRISQERAEADISTLFSGADLIPQGLYSLLVGGPAVVLSTYQSIMRLAGKDQQAAFPEGTWQFYLQFGLREDTGRHTCETLAYFRRRARGAELADDIAAWVMTGIAVLFDTDALNGTIWSEWTTLRLVLEAARKYGLADRLPFSGLVRAWQDARPYEAPAMASYADVRRRAFNEFLSAVVNALPDEALVWIRAQMTALAGVEQDRYQQQMSLLARLKPGRYRDERESIPLWAAQVGVIWRGHTTLFPAAAQDPQGRTLVFADDAHTWPMTFDKEDRPLDPDGAILDWDGAWLFRLRADGERDYVGYLRPPTPAQVKAQVESMLARQRPPSAARVDQQLVEAPRAEQVRLRKLLPPETQAALEDLSLAPILINWDEHDSRLPLGRLRRSARRGTGDHPLTILRTDQSIVFDLSHIFFDGLWGMAMAEALTNQAVAWCGYMKHTRPADAPHPRPEPLTLSGSPQFEKATLDGGRWKAPAEVDAESFAVDLTGVRQCRRWLAERGAALTVNDLLLLARVRQGTTYTPAEGAAADIAALPDDLRETVEDSLERTSCGVNPALLIPMDASLASPRERVFPTTFRSGLPDLLEMIDRAEAALHAYEAERQDQTWLAFEAARTELLTYLRAFGETLDTIKAIAMGGESFATSTLRLLGNLPASMQHLLNQIPERVGLLNEVLKGEEVFSNVGQVAEGSSLVRFMSAKDDGQAKSLVWGILTDDRGTMHLSLRDFRPHVGPLVAAGHEALAKSLAEDLLADYARGLNDMARLLGEIAVAEDIMTWG